MPGGNNINLEVCAVTTVVCGILYKKIVRVNPLQVYTKIMCLKNKRALLLQ